MSVNILICTSIRIIILYQHCGLLYKYHLRHAKWKGLFLSLQWVWTYSGFWDSTLKKWQCIVGFIILDNNLYLYEIDYYEILLLVYFLIKYKSILSSSFSILWMTYYCQLCDKTISLKTKHKPLRSKKHI